MGMITQIVSNLCLMFWYIYRLKVFFMCYMRKSSGSTCTGFSVHGSKIELTKYCSFRSVLFRK